MLLQALVLLALSVVAGSQFVVPPVATFSGWSPGICRDASSEYCPLTADASGPLLATQTQELTIEWTQGDDEFADISDSPQSMVFGEGELHTKSTACVLFNSGLNSCCRETGLAAGVDASTISAECCYCGESDSPWFDLPCCGPANASQIGSWSLRTTIMLEYDRADTGPGFEYTRQNPSKWGEQAGAAWLLLGPSKDNFKVDLRAGFFAKFSLSQVSTLATKWSENFPSCKGGVAFSLQALNPTVGGAYGYSSAAGTGENIVGVAFLNNDGYAQNLRVSVVSGSSDELKAASSPPVGDGKVPQGNAIPLAPIGVEIWYDSMTVPLPTLQVFVQDTLVLTQQVDLSAVFLSNPLPDTRRTPRFGYVGWTSGCAELTGSVSWITEPEIAVFSEGDATAVCDAALFDFYVNGTRALSVSGNEYSGFDYLARSIAHPGTGWRPGEIIAFRAVSKPSYSGHGCLVQARIFDTDIIPLDFSCSSTFNPSGSDWYADPAFVEDSSWKRPSVLGWNPVDVSWPRRHIPNFPVDTARIWANASGASLVYCRSRVPRFCFPQDDINSCINFETCDEALSLCVCLRPYTGEMCDQLEPISTSAILPDRASATGGTTARVIGDSFQSPMECVFGSQPVHTTFVDQQTVLCTVPPGVPNSTVQVRLIRIRSTNSTSSPLPFLYLSPLAITAVSPTQVLASSGASVILTGSGFEADYALTCRFSNGDDDLFDVPAFRLSSSEISCVVPQDREPAIVAVAVSANGVDFIRNERVSLVIYDRVSPLCRGTSTLTPGIHESFPFISAVDVARAGGRLFKSNVAYEAVVETNSSASPVFFNSTQLVDGDFCCELLGFNDGKFCGLLFDRSLNAAEVTLFLRKPAFVNEIVVTWRDPCNSAPLQYDILFRDLDHNWQPLTTRLTGGNSACQAAGGDNGPIAFCADFFLPKQMGAVRLHFPLNNTNEFVVPEGAWLHEIAVFGQNLDVPESLRAPTWSPGLLRSASRVELPNILVELVNSAGAAIPVPAMPVAIELRLLRENQLGAFDDVTSASTVVGNLSATFSVGPLFTDVALLTPRAGTYELELSVDNLQPLRLRFFIRSGEPVGITAVMPSADIIASANSALPAINVCVVDVAGNLATLESSSASTQGQPLNITAFSFSLDLSSSPSVKVTIGLNSTCATFSNLHVRLPVADRHEIRFRAEFFSASNKSIFEVAFTTVTILTGAPSNMIVVQAPSSDVDSGVPFPVQPILAVRDIAGNNVLAGKITVSIVPANISTNTSSATGLTGTSATIANGRARFSGLSFRGSRRQAYTLVFVASEAPNVSEIRTVRVRSCSESGIAFAVEGPLFQCQCLPGYVAQNATETGDVICAACPAGTAKSTISNSATCDPCSALETTEGRTAQRNCQCVQGLYRDVDTKLCSECPAGGVCKGDRVIGTLPGWWRPATAEARVISSEVVFYECHRGSPSSRELAAATEACPGHESSITPECGLGYDSTRCLACSGGFGRSGPFCRECPSDGSNAATFGAIILVIVVFITFLVFQNGNGERNKQAVSARILVSHLQMLGLLSAVGAAWTDPTRTLLLVGGLASFVDARLVASDCIWQGSYYARFAAFALLPLTMLAISLIVHSLIFVVRGFLLPCINRSMVVRFSSLRANTLSWFLLTLVVCNFVAYPSVCLKVLEVLDCSVTVGDTSYLNAAPEVECGTAEHSLWVVIAWAIIALYCIGAPLTVLVALWKWRPPKNESERVQMVLRFFYDGYKPDRYYWECITALRKFVLGLSIILTRQIGVLRQLYSFVWLVQLALLAHVLMEPYTSGRQARLELWSLITMLATLAASLYIPTLDETDVAALFLSALITFFNVVLILAFIFFITRGFARKLAPEKWQAVRRCYQRTVPKPLHARRPKLLSVLALFQMYATASDYDQGLLLLGLDRWWRGSANYAKKRFIAALVSISEGTPIAVAPFGDESTKHGRLRSPTFDGNEQTDTAGDSSSAESVDDSSSVESVDDSSAAGSSASSTRS